MTSLRTPSPKNEILVGGPARVEDGSNFQIGPRANVPRATRMLAALPLNKSYGNQISRSELLGQRTLVVDSENSVIGKSQSVFVSRMLYATVT